MTCQAFQDGLHDWFDGDVAPGQAAALREHSEECRSCQALVLELRALKAALAELPAPELSAERADRLLARVRTRSGLAWPAAATAAAAAVAVAALVVSLADGPRGVPGSDRATAASPVSEIELALHEPRTVRLGLSAEHALEGVLLVLELPPGVRLDGRPDQRILRWQTDLLAGANRLSLPLVADEPGVRELVARIEYQGRSREMRVRLRALAPGPVMPGAGAERSPAGRPVA